MWLFSSGFNVGEKVGAAQWEILLFVGDPVVQTVVPVKLRQQVLKVAHDESGQSGLKKKHMTSLFFWPHMKKDVYVFIKTCHTCQLTDKPNQTLKPAPLCPILSINQPFEQ